MVTIATEHEKLRRGRPGVWPVALGISMAMLALLGLASVAGSDGGSWARAVFAPLCHQNPDRCLEVLGRPMALCARCTTLYLGLALGVLIAARWPVRESVGRRALAIAVALLAADVVTEGLGLRESWLWLRMLTGLGLGVCGAGFTLRGVREVIAEHLKKGRDYERTFEFSS